MRSVVIALVALLSTALVAAPPEFGPQEPDARPVSFLSDTKAVLNYRTATAVPTRIQTRIGTLPASTPGQEKAWTGIETTDVDPEPKLVHSVTLHGLKPATRYYYRCFDPNAPKSDPPGAWSADPPWTREYAFATLAAKGETSFVRIPIKVLLVPNVINLDTVTADTPQPEPMPEKMMGADPDWFIENKLAKTKQGLSFFDPEVLAEYKRCFRNPATIHAICEDYRAAAGVDLAMDTEDFVAGRKIECPALILWGATGGVGRSKPSPGEIWTRYASNIVAAKTVPSGHYLSEEAPVETTAALREFFHAK